MGDRAFSGTGEVVTAAERPYGKKLRTTKVEIAKRQLDVAADLYFSGGDPLAVITLAGAAEEILGNLLTRNKAPNIMDRLVEMDKELFGGRPFAEVNGDVNGVRNALKHAKDAREDEIEIDLGAAMSLLSRAIVNYVALTGDCTPTVSRVYAELQRLHPDNQPQP